MPRQKNEIYGQNYRACPCAQIVQRDTAYTARLIEPTCYSPKRGRPCKINVRDIDQVRICTGGSAHGRRYTSCPYYVKNANTGVKNVVRKTTIAGFLTNMIMPLLFGWIGILLFKEGGTTNIGVGVVFLLVAFGMFTSLFGNYSNISGKKTRKKRKR